MIQLLFVSLALAASPTLDRIEQACLRNAAANGQELEAQCRCMKENYGRKLDEAGLASLWKLQRGELPKDEIPEALVDFDLEVTERCTEDPGWKWTAPKPAAKEEKGKKAPRPKGSPKTKDKAQGAKKP